MTIWAAADLIVGDMQDKKSGAPGCGYSLVPNAYECRTGAS